MTLSHGQAEVEICFNNNSLVLEDNFKISSIFTRSFINSYLIQKEIQPHKMPITPQVMRPFGAACDRYRLHLEEEKKNKVQEDIDSK